MNQNEAVAAYLTSACRTRPLMQIRDLFKLLHQSAFGCEHMVSSREAAEQYIQKEYESMPRVKDGTPKIEALCGAYSRVSLSLLDEGLSYGTLAGLFFLSAKKEEDGRAALVGMLDVAQRLAQKGELCCSYAEFLQARSSWEEAGLEAVRHTEAYRNAYHPAYRVIANEYLPLLPLLTELDRRLADGRSRVILALEGTSASGKTTLAALLQQLYGCTVLHMDDFFLQPEQRTPARLAEAGGNVDRERFLSEVLLPLSQGKDISYRRFDCAMQRVCPPAAVTPTRLAVVEGAYSMHPTLAPYYDLSAFLTLSEAAQRARIEKRNSPAMAARFFREWIPMERAYFAAFDIESACDFVISAEQ